MKLRSGYEDRKARVELVSLMDVMFLILVFFIYSIFSMTVHRGVRVNLPNAKGGKMTGEVSLITLEKDGLFSLDRQKMPSEEIIRIASARWREEARPVLISGDRDAPLGAGIELLGRLEKAGVEKVSFQVSGKTPEEKARKLPPPVPDGSSEK
ncbi:MAG: biopolymer transporter ExbD [Kiritimatiellae bacterium]|nr:biopolymer transporter ExbD [Kiritimatiellia bacterium]